MNLKNSASVKLASCLYCPAARRQHLLLLCLLDIQAHLNCLRWHLSAARLAVCAYSAVLCGKCRRICLACYCSLLFGPGLSA
jgi:hypothetical protein